MTAAIAYTASSIGDDLFIWGFWDWGGVGLEGVEDVGFGDGDGEGDGDGVANELEGSLGLG